MKAVVKYIPASCLILFNQFPWLVGLEVAISKRCKSHCSINGFFEFILSNCYFYFIYGLFYFFLDFRFKLPLRDFSVVLGSKKNCPIKEVSEHCHEFSVYFFLKHV